MKRRRRNNEAANHERWLVSYADFITLLLAFFVVMYASAQMNLKKAAALATAIQAGFQTMGAGPASGGSEAQMTTVSVSGSTEPPAAEAEARADSASEGDIDLLKRKLAVALKHEIEEHKVVVRSSTEGLVVSLHDVGFFRSGDDALLPESEVTFRRITEVLARSGLDVRVEGHTDNVPIHTSRFRSNWELSTARATQVVMRLVHEYGFDPQHISAAGYAEYRPVAANTTEDGRRLNRRLDLVVLLSHSVRPIRKADGGLGAF